MIIMIDNYVVNLFGNHRALPLFLSDLSDVVKHGLLLLLLPLLLEHLSSHHGLHLVSVVIFTLIKYIPNDAIAKLKLISLLLCSRGPGPMPP